jgi:precorrin-3B synthase
VLTSAARHPGDDACPGALRLHAAADGPLARVRLPGGLITGAQLRVLRELATAFGDGQVELTSRANLQLRALTDAPAASLELRLGAAGLLPSTTHELVRNIAASPLSPPAARAVVAALDRELCADPGLASLPGRFLFALDGGSGDVAGAADVAAVPADDGFAIMFSGVDAGLRVGAADVVPALLAAAHAFLAERRAQDADRPAWRLRELVDGPALVAARTAAALGVTLATAPFVVPRPLGRDLAGVVGQPDGLVAAAGLVPLGRLSGVQMKVLEKAELIVVTPWRGVVVPDLTPEAAAGWLHELSAAGLEVSPGSRWAGVTACAGRPGCAKALADVRADASVASVAETGRLLPVHWVGCARGCGSPAGRHVRAEATGQGYAVTGPGFAGTGSAAEVGALVAAARRG